MDDCCVYILAFSNKKIYVGIAADPEVRLSGHRCNKTSAVSHAIRKYGEPRLFTVAKGSRAECYELEEHLVYALDTLSPRGYNLIGGGYGPTEISEETLAKISESAKKRPPISDAIRAKMCQAQRDRFHMSDEDRARKKKISQVTRAEIIAANKNKKRKHSAATRAKISAANRARLPMSDVTRAKISQAVKNRSVSDATRAKMSVSAQGVRKPHSSEARANMSVAAKNKPPISEATRAKMSAASKRRWVLPEVRQAFQEGRERKARERLLEKARVS